MTPTYYMSVKNYLYVRNTNRIYLRTFFKRNEISKFGPICHVRASYLTKPFTFLKLQNLLLNIQVLNKILRCPDLEALK